MKKILKHFILFALFGAFGSAARPAPAELWTEGKEQPRMRVNVGAKAVSPDAYLRISEKYDAAVVNISTTKVFKSGRRGLFGEGPMRGPKGRRIPRPAPPEHPSPFEDFFGEDFFDWFFRGGPGEPPGDMRQKSLGSGFVLNPEGYIVTNHHVIDRADEIKVTLLDEAEYAAQVVGRDAKTDVALLKIAPKAGLVPVILGDSDALKVGDIVVAIGNPFGLSHSLTQGVVSAKERSIGFGSYDDFIQTDASINPGNSGGPLLNFYGEVVGINTAIVAGGKGIGFAIPINLAKGILRQLKEKGRVVRGWLGVYIQKVTEEHAKALKLKSRAGALVSEVQKKSPAEKAGLASGDVITAFDGKEIAEWNNLPILVADTPVGKKVSVDVIRDGKARTLTAEIAELKEEDSGAEAEESEAKNDRLGLQVQKLTPELARSLRLDEKTEGVLVTDVDPASPAAQKGVRRGDLILEVSREKVASVKAYRDAVSKLKKGDPVLLLVKRGEATLFVAFTL